MQKANKVEFRCNMMVSFLYLVPMMTLKDSPGVSPRGWHQCKK
jgi:hypothetical protein